jgi:shikimate kinase
MARSWLLKKRSGKTVADRRRTRGRPSRPSAKGLSIPGNSVFLVGFMGAGKSTVGRALGQRLNWIFEDLDDRIEAREGRTVAEIFRDSGESEFRRAEQAALEHVLGELRGGVARIVALGGGAFVQEENAARLKAAGVPTIFLDAPVEELWQRCRSQASATQASESGTERPLLRSLEQFRKLYETRHSSYSKATLQILTGGRAVETIAAEIAEALGLKTIELRTEQGENE